MPHRFADARMPRVSERLRMPCYLEPAKPFFGKDRKVG